MDINTGKVLYMEYKCFLSRMWMREGDYCIRGETEGMKMLFDWHSQDSRANGPLDVACTVTAQYGTGGGNTPMVVHIKDLTPGETQAQKVHSDSGIYPCLTARERGGGITRGILTKATGINGDVSSVIDASYFKGPGERGFVEREIIFQDALCSDLENLPDQIVRRLIPLECGRLQGFPDGWGEIAPFGARPDDADFWPRVYITAQQIAGKKINAKIVHDEESLAAWYGKLHSRQAEYKMWGNGMALPNALFFVQRAVEVAAKDKHSTPERIKLGSLFDGSGTMPLAAELCGARAIWASEVEPYPIAVTRTHLPGLVHLGSVTEIDGGKIPPVDIITFGSPCQDLSTAGKRAGMKNTSRGDDETTRSGLFFEAIRIAREMLAATGGVYPRFVIWENVPGALSSNAGADFEVVLNGLLQLSGANDVIRQHGRWEAPQTTERWPIELSTRNTGECPSAGVESTLSQILVENPPVWSLLSEKALRGILNRAEKRKERLNKAGLPDCLVNAINGMIAWWQKQPPGDFAKPLKNAQASQAEEKARL